MPIPLSTRRLALITLAATMFTPVAGLAQTPDIDLETLMERADANKDGDIAWSEVTDMRSQIFARLDRDGDAVISQADRPPARFGKRFDDAVARLGTQFDVNSDGDITQSEMLDGPSLAFDAGDANNDGVLSADEIAALRAARSAN